MVRAEPATWADVDAVIRSSGDPSAYSLGSTSIIASPSLLEDEWYVNALLVPHEGLRYILLMLERSVQPQHLQPARAWKVQRLFHFYHHLRGYVSDHHRTEDVHYFPWISTRAPLPSRLHAEHEGLQARLEAITAMERTLQSCKGETEVSRWASELREQAELLAQFMRDHLTEEETLVIPALRDHFTPQEHDVVLIKMAQDLPPASMPVAIAVSCAGQLRAGGEQLLNGFLSHLPPPAVEAWKGMWRPQIEAEMAYVDSITLDQDDEPPFDKSRLFPIEDK